MNKERREKILAAAGFVESLYNNLSSLSAFEQVGEAGSPSERDLRVAGWRRELAQHRHQLILVARREERVRPSRRHLPEVLAMIQRAAQPMHELAAVECPARFVEMFHERYDDMVVGCREAIA